MNPIFIPAADLLVLPGQAVEALPDGAVRSEPGNQGPVLHGPYMGVGAGVYRIRARARTVEPGVQSYFDIDAETRNYAARHYSDGVEVFVHLYETKVLEFRFWARGEEFIVEGVELEPLLLDTDPAGPELLGSLLERLIPQDSEADAVYRLIHRLESLGETEAAERHRDAFLQRGDVLAKRVRAAFLELNTPGVAALSDHAETPMTREDIAQVLGRRTLTRFDALRFTPDDEARLRQLGYEPDFLQATRWRRDFREPKRNWELQPDETLTASEFTSRPPMFERFAEMDRSFQWALARGDGMAAHCPATGRLVHSRHGFCQPYAALPFTFYRFEGAEVFYVMTGHVSNAQMAIYMPRTGVIVEISDPYLRQYSMEHAIGMFDHNMVDFRREVVAYLQAQTRPALTIGSNIFGHMIWTSLPGLQFAADSGVIEHLVEVIGVPRYYIDTPKMFPELADRPHHVFNDDALAFKHCVERRLLPIHFTDAYMNDAFVERFRRAAETHATSAGWAPADAPRPLLWFTLRVHNKSWVGQVEGYVEILNALFREYGSASVFLDGLPDCAEAAAEIRARTHPDVVIYDGLRLTPYDTFNWIWQADAYISQMSGGLVMVHHVGGKPGVAHAEHEHLKQIPWWHMLRREARPPCWVSPDEVTDLGQGLYGNYDVDWRVLLDKLRPLLDERFTRIRPA